MFKSVIYLYFIIFNLPKVALAIGQPEEWQLGFQDAASPLMQNLIDFHDFVFWIITAITVFVFLLLAYVCVRFSAKNNKTIVVEVTRKFKHPFYGKVIKRTKKYHAHDEKNKFKEGEKVSIIECKPISKKKTWQVVQ